MICENSMILKKLVRSDSNEKFYDIKLLLLLLLLSLFFVNLNFFS